MISFWRIFWLEILTLVRSRTVGLLTFAGVAWMLVFPHIVKGDGTPDGARELYVHYSLGGVFILLVIALLASATGTIATERAAKRLQLTMVRPVRYFAIALGKMLAHVAVGAVVMAVVCAVLAWNVDVARPCNHVLSPVMLSPQDEAKAMYESYMQDPETPDEVKKAKKEVVLRLLTQKAIDNYQNVATNSVTKWKFGLGESALDGRGLPSVRMRFTNQMEMRQEVLGEFRLGGLVGVVSNMTQAVIEIPLRGEAIPDGETELKFINSGKYSLMLRPRKDINLLLPADAFGWNLLRTYLGLVSILALVVAGGTFLSAALGRPVAVFVAFVMLIVSEMSPSVIEQYPDALETNLADRIGLHITRCAVAVTRPLSSAAPLGALAKDECVEPAEVVRLLAYDCIALPIALALLAAFIMPRKQEDMG